MGFSTKVNIRKFVVKASRLRELVELGSLTAPTADLLDASVSPSDGITLHTPDHHDHTRGLAVDEAAVRVWRRARRRRDRDDALRARR